MNLPVSHKDADSSALHPPDSRQGEQSATAALRESGVVLRLSTGAGRIATWDLDLATGECLISPRMAQLIGLSPDQATVLSSVWWERVVPEDRPRLWATVNSAVESGDPFDIEFRVRLEDGTDRWLYVQGAMVGNESGKALRLHGASIDITERKRVEEALRESKQRIQKALEIDTVGVLFFSAAGEFTQANNAFLKMAGLSRETFETKQLRFEDIALPEWLPRTLQALDELNTTGRSTPYEKELFRPDGSRWWGLFAATGLNDKENMEYVLDITERKQAEEALRKREAELKELNATLEQRVSERTRAVRQLAAELTLAESRERHRIAQLLHDELQQQLHGVQFALHDTQRFLDSSDVKAGQGRLEEAYKLLRTALSISRGLTSDLSPTVLSDEGLIEALHWLATRMQELHGLQVNLRVAKELPLPHDALRVLLFQIVRELLFNVVKHAGVGEATVTLRQEAGTLEIEVADQGQGFDPAHLVSTISKETGLGLASIQNRLEFFGGGLEVLSAPGKGSSFTIVLPTASLTLG